MEISFQNLLFEHNHRSLKKALKETTFVCLGDCFMNTHASFHVTMQSRDLCVSRWPGEIANPDVLWQKFTLKKAYLSKQHARVQQI